ncbi:MAG: hypothetical protein HGB15_06170 [Chlorobaculum sp.]|nr:hypothetical protein [Chlorobaculum sp.]
MFKFILLLVVLWLALRLVGRIIGLTSFTVRRDERPSSRASSFSSSRRREAVEEAEFEVIDSHIKEKE